MMPIVLLNTLGGPSPAYLRWLLFSERNGLAPAIVHHAENALVDRIAPSAIVLVRTLYTLQPCRVEWCEHSAAGAEMGAHVAVVAASMRLNAEFSGRYPSLLEGYTPDGLDVTLTGHLLADTDTLEAVATGLAAYLKMKGLGA